MSYNDDYSNSRKQGLKRRKMHYSPNLLDCINNSLIHRKTATLEYEAKDYQISTRKIEPMALIYKNYKRHLVAFCRLRNDYRTFRLDKINLIKIHQEHFDAREDFNVEAFEIDDDYLEWDENLDNETEQ